jgi:hypothetical protein
MKGIQISVDVGPCNQELLNKITNAKGAKSLICNSPESAQEFLDDHAITKI